MSNSTNFNFDFSKLPHPTEVILDLDAHYPPQNPVLRLTAEDNQGRPQLNSSGRAVYNKLVANASFNTKVKFFIKPEDDLGYGDGLVFFIVSSDHSFPGVKGGNQGIFEKSDPTPGVFAVGFNGDTNNNDQIIFGIYIESRNPVAQTLIPKDDILKKSMELDVSYNSFTREIKASIPTPYEVRHTADLSHILTRSVRIGLGSSTSDVRVGLHDVNTWAFSS